MNSASFKTGLAGVGCTLIAVVALLLVGFVLPSSGSPEMVRDAAGVLVIQNIPHYAVADVMFWVAVVAIILALIFSIITLVLRRREV